MRLTTLGTGTSSPSATRVNAGHLVEAGDVRLLMDCGSAVVHRMATLGVDWMGITHVAITHFHADHLSDIATLVTAWRWGVLPARTAPAAMIGPPGFRDEMERLAGTFGAIVTAPGGFDVVIQELPPGESMEVGAGVRLEARKVPHTPESIAYSVEHGGRRLVYTGDMGFDPAFGEWAHGCDLLLCECSLPDAMGIPIHLTPGQCAAIAAAADPRRLVLTHFYPPVEEVDVAAIVAARWPGELVLATDGWTTEIEER